MIKARFNGTNRATLVFGLSGENVTRLAAGEPMLIRGEELGVDGYDMVLLYGKTNEDVVEAVDTLRTGLQR